MALSPFSGLFSGPTLIVAQTTQVDSMEPLRVLAYNSRGFFCQGESGPSGVEYDLLRYYADRNGRTLEVIWVDQFEDLIPRLIAGDGDLISATMTITSKRQRIIDFTTSYFPVQIRLITREDRPITDLAQLNDETVAAIKGTTGEKALIKIPGTNVVTGEVLMEILEKVLTGEIRAVATDTSMAFAYFLEMPGLDFGPALSEEQNYGFGIALGNEDLRESLNRHIRELKLSKIYYRLLEDNLGVKAVSIVRAGKL